jgi:hypothetical protein
MSWSVQGRYFEDCAGNVPCPCTASLVPFAVETGEPARIVGIFGPVGSELTISKGGGSAVSAFGVAPALAGRSGFSSAFAWSA